MASPAVGAPHVICANRNANRTRQDGDGRGSKIIRESRIKGKAERVEVDAGDQEGQRMTKKEMKKKKTPYCGTAASCSSELQRRYDEA